MKRRKHYQLAFGLGEDANGRTLSLEADGIDSVPAFGLNHYQTIHICNEYHSHPECVEFVFCLRGDGVYSTPDGEYKLKAGMVFVSKPNQPHFLKAYHKGLRLYWIHVRLPTREYPILGLSMKESRWIAKNLLSFRNRVFKGSNELRHAFRRLFKWYDQDAVSVIERAVQLKAAVLDLLLAALASSEIRAVAPSSKVVEGVADEMRRHPEQAYPLANIADKLNMSVSNLMLAFKRQTGVSPHAFLLARRIERAQKMLQSGKRITEVAVELGFSTQKRFSAYFRQSVGASPRDWLKAQK